MRSLTAQSRSRAQPHGPRASLPVQPVKASRLPTSAATLQGIAAMAHRSPRARHAVVWQQMAANAAVPRSMPAAATVLQRQVMVAGVAYNAGALIHRLWLRGQDNDDGLVWHDSYRDAVFALSAANRQFANDGDLTMALAGHSMADRNIAAPVLAARSDGFMANIVYAVSEPSAAHRLELITSKYNDIAAHVYGWSLCARATMQADVLAINAYLLAIRTGGIVPGGVSWQWNNSLDQRVEFTVNGRTYSTHQIPGHPQLYPLRGANILHGNGPLDMARTLRDRGQLTDDRKVKLYQVHAARQNIADVNQRPLGQLGSRLRAEYAAALSDLL